jgi:hypothetical protein
MVVMAVAFVGVAAVAVDAFFAVVLAFIFAVTGVLALIPIETAGKKKRWYRE